MHLRSSNGTWTDILKVLTTTGVRKGHHIYQSQLWIGNINLARSYTAQTSKRHPNNVLRMFPERLSDKVPCKVSRWYNSMTPNVPTAHQNAEDSFRHSFGRALDKQRWKKRQESNACSRLSFPQLNATLTGSRELAPDAHYRTWRRRYLKYASYLITCNEMLPSRTSLASIPLGNSLALFLPSILCVCVCVCVFFF